MDVSSKEESATYVALATSPFDGRFYLSARRLIDGALAAAALLFLVPAILVVSVLLLIIDGRPVFFAHKRVGKDGVSFKCFKFRTMVRDAEQQLARVLESSPQAREEWERSQKLADDPRIHWLGRFLRRTSIDEIPQFWNVILGNMAIVGPRPITDGEQVRYGEHISFYRSMMPGITGLWQVSGRNDVDYKTRVMLDLEYYTNRSIILDIKILLKTVKVCLLGLGSL